MADSAPPVLPMPSTKGGADTFFHLISAATNNATSVRSSRACISYIQVSNNAATVSYLKIYNTAAAPVYTTDTPILTILVPIKGTVTMDLGAFGINLTNGIGITMVTGMAVSDNTSVGASEMSVGIAYT